MGKSRLLSQKNHHILHQRRATALHMGLNIRVLFKSRARSGSRAQATRVKIWASTLILSYLFVVIHWTQISSRYKAHAWPVKARVSLHNQKPKTKCQSKDQNNYNWLSKQSITNMRNKKSNPQNSQFLNSRDSWRSSKDLNLQAIISKLPSQNREDQDRIRERIARSLSHQRVQRKGSWKRHKNQRKKRQ